MRQLGHLNLAFVIGLTLIAGYVSWRRGERDARWTLLWKLFTISTPVLLISNSVVESLMYLMPAKVDLYMFCGDRLLGQPSFHVGQFLQRHHWLGNTSLIAYILLPVPLYLLAVVYVFAQPPGAARVYVRTLVLNFALCIPLYLAIPVAGPYYAFSNFPRKIPEVISPHLTEFSSIPNGFPSVHTSTALIMLHFASRWRVGGLFASIYLVLVLLATLGTGEHYCIDLIAGAIYATCVIWVGSEQAVHVHRLRALPVLSASEII